jgi:muramoyltetrapeptide carboxypeptidase
MPTKLLKPKPLRPKSQIGIVSPARWAAPDVIHTGKAMLENMGYSVFVHPQNMEKDFQLAGSDEARAEAIMDLFEDPSIDAILCPRGGIGSYRVIPHLKWDVIMEHPKIFCGFSDITTLLIAMHQRTGLVTFHGPLLMNFFGEHEPYNLDFMLKMMLGKVPVGEIVHYPEAKAINEGKATGKLIGGNITLLQHMIATKDDINTDGAILFIEDDAGEKLSDIDRKLWHLKNAGKFQRIAGLIVGDFPKGFRSDDNGAWGHEVPELLKTLVPSHIPVCYNFPCAHGRKVTTLPEGVQASLEISAKGAFLSLLESPFA